METKKEEKRISRAQMLRLMKQSTTAAFVSPAMMWTWYYYSSATGWQHGSGSTSSSSGWNSQKGWTKVQTNQTAKQLNQVSYPSAIAADDYQKQRERKEKNRPTDDFVDAVNSFSSRTVSALLAGQKGNANYSPLSLYYALTLAALGAKGETREELLALLGEDKLDTLTTQAGKMFRFLYAKNKVHTLTMANSAWLASGGTYSTEFIKNAGEKLYAEIFGANFGDAKLGKVMGDWVSQKTGGMLSAPLEVSRGTRAVLLNTVLFKDEWLTGFQEKNTRTGNFSAPRGTVKAQFMRRTVGGGYTRGTNWTRATLPLKNGEMVFILPDSGITPEKLLAQPERLAKILNTADENYGEVTWQLPRFDFGVKYDLIGMLKKLGLSDPFDPTAADFSGMAKEKLYIDSAIQQSRITVNEKGVAAAAYTELGMNRMSLPQNKLNMTLDRPFLYAIMEENIPLFIGVCSDPTSNK